MLVKMNNPNGWMVQGMSLASNEVRKTRNQMDHFEGLVMHGLKPSPNWADWAGHASLNLKNAY